MFAVQHRPQAMASGRHSEAEPAQFFGCMSYPTVSNAFLPLFSVSSGSFCSLVFCILLVVFCPSTSSLLSFHCSCPLTAKDSFEDFSLQNAPDPAPGAPLLSDNEQKALDSWFEEMTSGDRVAGDLAVSVVHSENWNDFPPSFVGSATSFGLAQNPHHAPPHHHGLEQDFVAGLPFLLSQVVPAAQPVAQPMQTAFPPASSTQSSTALAVPPPSSSLGHHFSVTPAVTSGIDHVTDEVVAAAALLRNRHDMRHASFPYDSRSNHAHPHHGHGGQLDSRHSSLGQTPAPPQPGASSIIPRTALLSPVAHLAEQPSVSPTAVSTTHLGGGLDVLEPSGLVAPRHISLSSMSSTGHHGRPSLQWGTDTGFSSGKFEPQSEKETSEHLTNEHLRSMECLQMSQSANTTRPPSPMFDASFSASRLTPHTASFAVAAEANSNREATPPRKRRKGRGVRGEDLDPGMSDTAVFDGSSVVDDDGADFVTNRRPRKRKAKSAPNGHMAPQSSASPPGQPLATAESPIANGTNGDGANGSGAALAKRRRSSAVAKAPRENLSDEQKRENHIKSEQKRRSLIKTGFDDLCLLVPGLQGGSVSKSVMLTVAGDWLEDLLKGNKRLKDQLRRM